MGYGRVASAVGAGEGAVGGAVTGLVSRQVANAALERIPVEGRPPGTSVDLHSILSPVRDGAFFRGRAACVRG